MAIDQKNLKPIAAGTAPSAAKPELKPLMRGDCALLEFSNNSWRVTVPAGVSPRDLDMHPTFWNALADEVREGDDVKAFAKDRAWVARFEVVDAVIGRAAVRLAYVLEGAPRLSVAGPKPIPDNHDIKRNGPDEPDGYTAFRVSDGVRMAIGSSWQECYEALLKHANFQTEKPTKYVP